MILSYNLKIMNYGYHYIYSVYLFFSTAYSIIVTVLNELLVYIIYDVFNAMYLI